VTKDWVYFANDNPFGQNYIRRLNKRTLKAEALVAIIGPAWYGYMTSDGVLFFASTVEYSVTTKDIMGHLYSSANGLEWWDIFQWRKDGWKPWWLFQFGVVSFPGGKPTDSGSVWLSGQGFVGFDMCAWRISVRFESLAK
jgi:hypothetical protein